MALRYEIRDTHNPRQRGQRFSTKERALRELSKAYPPERWELIDRTTGQVVEAER